MIGFHHKKSKVVDTGYGYLEYSMGALAFIPRPDANALSLDAKKLVGAYNAGLINASNLRFLYDRAYRPTTNPQMIFGFNQDKEMARIFNLAGFNVTSHYEGSFSNRKTVWNFPVGAESSAKMAHNYINNYAKWSAYSKEQTAKQSEETVAAKKAIEELRLQNAAALAQADVERSAWLKEKIALEQSILKAKLAREQSNAARDEALKNQELERIEAEAVAKKNKARNKKLAIGGAVAAAAALMLT
jgi:hypothetical protein